MDFSNDPKTQNILRDFAKFESERKDRFRKVVSQYNERFYKHRAWRPMRSSNGVLILPFQEYWARYNHEAKKYIEITERGGLRVTDPIRHYFAPTEASRVGKPVEIYSRYEYVIKKLKD